MPIDQLNAQQAVGIVEEMIDSGKPHVIATANVDFLAQVQEDEDLRQILHDADLILCDGTPLLWMSKWLGDPLPERLAGSDMVPVLLGLAQEKGYRVFFLGGHEEVVPVAEGRIRERWPRLDIVGMYSPPYAPLDGMDHEDTCRRIRESGADMLFVSFGCPKQEKWLAMNFRKAGVPVAMGVGATIDFLAGTMKRAPVWMRKTGLEWLFRLLQEPRRLAKRYWTDFRVVVPGLLAQLFRMRSSRGGRAAGGEPAVVAAEAMAASASAPVIRLPERLDALAARDPSLWPAEVPATVVIDASGTTFLDSTGSGRLARLARTTRELGGCCILAGAKAPVTRTLELMKLRGLFVEADTLEEGISKAKS